MNILKYILLTFVVSVVSCGKYEPVSPYVYETNPHYSWGTTQYFGPYYKNYGNPNNVISLSLFSDSLGINKDGNLVGFGQFLFLEDVFVNTTSTQLLMGKYTVSGAREQFTIAPGVLDTIDNEVYTLGAMISYYEENSFKSTLKMISSGTVDISRSLTGYTIYCDLKTSDNMELKGNFTGELTYFDESISTTPQIFKARKRIIYKH